MALGIQKPKPIQPQVDPFAPPPVEDGTTTGGTATSQTQPTAATQPAATPNDAVNPNTPYQWTPQNILQMSNQVAAQTGAKPSSQENLDDWLRNATTGQWTYDQALQEMTRKALEPDLSQQSAYSPVQSGALLAALAGQSSGVAAAPVAGTPGNDTSWMQGNPPAPGWVAVPGVGWVPPDNPAAQNYVQQNPQAGQAAAPNNSPASIDDQMRTALMQMLQTPNTVNAASLDSSPEMAAYRLSAQRGAERSQAQVAEQAAQNGFTGTGGFEGQLRGIGQARSEAEAGFAGQLASTKLQQNIDQLKFAISTAQSAGQFDKAQALQLQLAQMQDALGRAQLAQQGQQAQADLELRRQLGLGGLDLSYAQLAQQGQIANNQLGFDYTQLQTNANQAALLALLGGG